MDLLLAAPFCSRRGPWTPGRGVSRGTAACAPPPADALDEDELLFFLLLEFEPVFAVAAAVRFCWDLFSLKETCVELFKNNLFTKFSAKTVISQFSFFHGMLRYGMLRYVEERKKVEVLRFFHWILVLKFLNGISTRNVLCYLDIVLVVNLIPFCLR